MRDGRVVALKLFSTRGKLNITVETTAVHEKLTKFLYETESVRCKQCLSY
jgi:hypothetical protein